MFEHLREGTKPTKVNTSTKIHKKTDPGLEPEPLPSQARVLSLR